MTAPDLSSGSMGAKVTRQTKISGRQRRNGQKPKHEQLAEIIKLQPVQDIIGQIREDYTTGSHA